MTTTIRVPVVIGPNRLRGKAQGAMVDDSCSGAQEALQAALRDEAKAKGIEPTPAWLATSTSQLLRLYEEAQSAYEASKGDAVGHVFEGVLPSGRTILMGDPRTLGRVAGPLSDAHVAP